MLQVKRHYNKFRVTYVGQRYKLDVDNLAQVAQVMTHYFTPGDNAHDRKSCPVCKDIEAKS